MSSTVVAKIGHRMSGSLLTPGLAGCAFPEFRATALPVPVGQEDSLLHPFHQSRDITLVQHFWYFGLVLIRPLCVAYGRSPSRALDIPEAVTGGSRPVERRRRNGPGEVVWAERSLAGGAVSLLCPYARAYGQRHKGLRAWSGTGGSDLDGGGYNGESRQRIFWAGYRQGRLSGFVVEESARLVLNFKFSR